MRLDQGKTFREVTRFNLAIVGVVFAFVAVCSLIRWL